MNKAELKATIDRLDQKIIRPHCVIKGVVAGRMAKNIAFWKVENELDLYLDGIKDAFYAMHYGIDDGTIYENVTDYINNHRVFYIHLAKEAYNNPEKMAKEWGLR